MTLGELAKARELLRELDNCPDFALIEDYRVMLENLALKYQTTVEAIEAIIGE